MRDRLSAVAAWSAAGLVLAAFAWLVGGVLSRFGVRLIALAFPSEVPFYISFDAGWIVVAFGHERAEHPVPHHENARVVAVDVTGVRRVMHAMV